MNSDELRAYIKRIKRNAAKRRKATARMTNHIIAKYRDGVYGKLMLLKPYYDPRPNRNVGKGWTRLALVGRDGMIYERGAKFELQEAYKLVDASKGNITFKEGDPRRG